jgi:hypothetical protein
MALQTPLHLSGAPGVYLPEKDAKYKLTGCLHLGSLKTIY